MVQIVITYFIDFLILKSYNKLKDIEIYRNQKK